MLRCVQCTVHSSHTEFTTVFFTVGPFWMNINFNMQSYVNACGGTNNFHSMDSLPSVWSTSKQIYHSCTGQPSTNDLSQQSFFLLHLRYFQKPFKRTASAPEHSYMTLHDTKTYHFVFT